MKSIILAGGSGTRLWPLSREKYPKQFLKFGKTSLFQNTIERCLEISDVNDIFIVTNEFQKFFVIGQTHELGLNIPNDNILIEPKGKNTLPAICLGMRYIENIENIEKKPEKSTVGVFPSDHMLDKSTMRIIADAELLTSEYLVTFGTVPTCPHTGYGYISISDPININGIETIGHKAGGFKEKPSIENARKFVDDGNLWNSGMFLFNTQIFFNELKKHFPEIYNIFEDIRFNNNNNNLVEIYNNLPSISIDYGIMEKSANVAVVRLDQKWSDVGNFEAMYNEFGKDNFGNVTIDCDKVLINSNNNLIYSGPKKLISLIDVNDLIVVDADDATLICPRSSSQKVKDIVKILKDRKDERAYVHNKVYKPWGFYTTLEKSETHKIKNITVMPQEKLSLQLHYHRNEHWAVVKGIALVHVDGNEFFLRTGESTFIKEGIKHRLSNPGKIPLEIIEVQLGDVVDEDDIVRFDDNYGRV